RGAGIRAAVGIGIRRTAGSQGRHALFYIHFFLGLHDRLSGHFHGLNLADLITRKADKDYILGRRAVDPLFIVLAVIVLLSDFLFRTLHRHDHHLAVHADQYFMLGDGGLDRKSTRLNSSHLVIS